MNEPTILLVDESHDNALLIGSAFDRAGLGRPLRFARDGEQAIAYLRGDGVHADRTRFPVPAALLIDLETSGGNGFMVLAWVSQQPRLRPLRSYVLSGSNRREDIDQAYALGASAYLLKPEDPAALTQLAVILITWLKVCHFPLKTGTDAEREASILAARSSLAGAGHGRQESRVLPVHPGRDDARDLPNANPGRWALENHPG